MESAQPNQLIAVQLIGSSEVVDDFCYRLTRNGVAFVVGQLEVLDDRSVFVLPFCGSQVHAYQTSMYLIQSKGFFV